MSNRTYLSLIVLLAVLVGLAVWNSKKPEKATREKSLVGEKVIGSIDINEVSKFVMKAPGETSTVARKEGKWVVSSLWDYPANFDKVAETLRTVAELKIGQVARSGEKYLEEFGLKETATGMVRSITLFGADNGEVGRLQIGNTISGGQQMTPYGMMPGGAGGNYVRMSEGPVVAVKDTLVELFSKNTEWIKRELIAAPADSISEVDVTVSNETAKIRVMGPELYALEGLKEGEKLNNDVARRPVHALQNIMLVTVVDPQKSDSDMGLDKPNVYKAKTKDGLIYTIHIGKGASEGNGRYVRLAVAFEKPAAPSLPSPPPAEGDTNALTNEVNPMAEYSNEVARIKSEFEEKTANAKQLAEEQSKLFSRWVYILFMGDCENMTVSRKQLLAPPEKVEEQTKNEGVSEMPNNGMPMMPTYTLPPPATNALVAPPAPSHSPPSVTLPKSPDKKQSKASTLEPPPEE